MSVECVSCLCCKVPPSGESIAFVHTVHASIESAAEPLVDRTDYEGGNQKYKRCYAPTRMQPNSDHVPDDTLLLDEPNEAT